ncbi:MAG TPA: heme ABC transporter permease CcmC [Arenimonas sp.]|uniref:heme ABC transporter permease CcmC n=1 Tax=Arenimonas sp. TaxID=1872635 RepID=UPI002C259A61|nr:heme ABC transporter permease CcmC [Arenimonas sp.]HMB56636.1 heme ABC transporter permease CcmC [Arenimonas sp.]
MNRFLLWFHQTGSPANFDRYAARWAPWAFATAFVALAVGIYGALFSVPPDVNQGENFRILYIHVPSAWMSLFIFIAMAIQAVIALVWRIKICEILAMSCAPIGAAFTVITLATGSIWGKPTWGTWWSWDARLTSELVMLFLYIGVIGLNSAIEDRRAAARAACFLAIIGLVNVPIVHYAVDWWNTLHQGETIRLLGPSKMDSSMMWPLIATVIGTKAWFVGSLLQRARATNLEHEANKDWARSAYGATQ